MTGDCQQRSHSQGKLFFFFPKTFYGDNNLEKLLGMFISLSQVSIACCGDLAKHPNHAPQSRWTMEGPKVFSPVESHSMMKVPYLLLVAGSGSLGTVI